MAPVEARGACRGPGLAPLRSEPALKTTEALMHKDELLTDRL